MWERKRLLIWGTTYPEFSRKYYETVCTGAVDDQTGRLVRIYPITLRYMKEPFHRFDWIEADVERNQSDYRPESYRINQDTIRVVDHIETKKAGWAERAKWVLGSSNVFPSVEALWDAQKRDHTSLGLVKPRSIRAFSKRRPAEERQEWEQKREEAISQQDLFVDVESKANLAFIPVQYRVEFNCLAHECNGHDMSILDWGTYALSRKVFAAKGSPAAESDVIAKIEESMDDSKHDVYLFLGNTKEHPDSFMVVGFFCPRLGEDRDAEAKPRQTGWTF